VNEYDVIVLDRLLPGKDGIAVCQALRARDLSTPILILTRAKSRRSGQRPDHRWPTTTSRSRSRSPSSWRGPRALLRRSRLAQASRAPRDRSDARPVQPPRDPRRRAYRLTSKEYTILEVLMQNAARR